MVALVAGGLGGSSASAETRYAVVVGHNVGHLDEVPLRWAQSDAIRFRKILSEIGNIAPERATLLLGPQPAELERALIQMEGRLLEAKNRGERTLLVFYFSGHADKDALHLGSASVPMAELERKLKAGPAHTTLSIIDACQNDRTPRASTKGAVRAPTFSWPSPGESAPAGYVSIKSAAEGEVAQESDDLQGSLFTHHLLSGMRGSADFDSDGTVTLTELYRYGYSRTLEDSHRAARAVQHSALDMNLSGQGTFIVTYPRRAASTLVLGEGILGHVLLIDDRSGRIVAEVHQEGTRSVQLAVAPGTYRVQLRGQTEVRTGLVSLGTGVRAVTVNDLKVQPALAVLEKGARYDPHPYVLMAGTEVGSSLVQGFGVASGVRLGADYRVTETLRLVVAGDARYASADNAQWRFRQVELGLHVGGDWVFGSGPRWAVLLGVRAGTVAVLQEGVRQEQSRLIDGWVPEVSTEIDGANVGLSLKGRVGFEYFPWSQVGLRLFMEPSTWWIASENQSDLQFGVSGGLSMIVRL